MKWTDVKPTEPGLYFNRIETDSVVMSVKRINGVLSVQSHCGFERSGNQRIIAVPIEMVTGQWSDAPIPEPEGE
jgi:hypothetical protein